MSRLLWVSVMLGGASALLLFGGAEAQTAGGNIEVTVRGWASDGPLMQGATVVLILPGNNGFGTDDDTVAKVTDATGKVVFTFGTDFGLSDLDAASADGPSYKLRVDRSGYVQHLQTYSYRAETASLNERFVNLQPTISITFSTEKNGAVNGGNVTLFSNGAVHSFATDGGANDADGVVNDKIQYPLPPAQAPGSLVIVAGKPGFVEAASAPFVLSSTNTPPLAFQLQYRLKVIVKDELGIVHTSGDPVVKHGGVLASTEKSTSTGEYWVATTAAEGALEVSRAGYVSLNIAEDTGLASVRTSKDAQTVVTLSGAAPYVGTPKAGDSILGSGLKFTLKVVLNDEVGHPVPETPVANLLTHNAVAFHARNGTAYYFRATANGPLAIEKPGFVSLSTAAGGNTGLTSVQVSTEDQTVVTLSGLTPYTGTHAAGADVTASGLKYQLKVVVKDELGLPLTVGGPNHGPAPNATVVFNNVLPDRNVGNVAYFAPPVSATPRALDAWMPGFVSLDRSVDTGLTYLNVSTSAQTTITLSGLTPFTTQSVQHGGSHVASGLKYRLKVLLNDEAGYGLAAAGAVTAQNGTGADFLPPTAVAGNASYFTNTSAVTVKAARPGFLTSTVAGVPSTAAQQTVVDLNGTAPAASTATWLHHPGLAYKLKVLLSDEFNATLAGATVTYDGLAAARVSGNVSYFANPSATQGDVVATMAGYVSSTVPSVATADTAQTVVGFFGNATAGASVPLGATGVGPGLRYPVRIHTLQDELGNALPIVPGSVACPAGAATVRGGMAYCAMSGTGAVVASTAGLVSSSASVTPQPGLQRQVCFCVAPDPGDVAGAPLAYRLKVLVHDELGNPVSGATVTHAGAAAAQRVAEAHYFATTGAGAIDAFRPGYVTLSRATGADAGLSNIATLGTKQTVVTLTGATPYAGSQAAAGDDATGSGLKFRLKVMVNDETGGSLPASGTVPQGVANVTVTYAGLAPTRAAGNASYFAHTQTGGLAVSMPGMMPFGSANTGFASFSTSSAAQTVVLLDGSTPFTGTPAAGQTSVGTALRYPLKVVTNDELGENVTTANVQHAGVAPTRVVGNASYFAATGAGQLTFAPVGYLSPSDANPGLSNVAISATAQTVLVFNGAGTPLATPPPAGTTTTLGGLPYAVKVLGVADESGNAAPGATIHCGVPAVVRAGVHYCALTGARVVTASSPGRVSAAYTLPASSVQKTIRFGGAGEADVVRPALAFRLKVLVQDELGDDVNATVLHGGAAASFVSGNARYFATTSPGALSVQAPGMVSLSTAVDTGLAQVGTTDQRQATIRLTGTTPFTGAQTPGEDAVGSGLRYALKVVVHDELGAARTGATVRHAGSSAARTVDNVHYFAANSSGTLVVERAGYVSLDTLVDTGLGNLPVSAAAQTTVTLSGATPYTGTPAAGQSIVASGLKHRLKVTVADELGNPLTGALVTHGGAAPRATVGATHYFATEHGPLAASRAGYAPLDRAVDTGLANVSTTSGRQTTLTLSGAAPYTGSAFAGGAATASGLKHSLKVLDVQDVLGNGLPIGTAAIITCSGVTPLVVQGVAYCAAQETGTLVTATAAGYVPQSVALNPGDAQATVRFGPGAASLPGPALEHALRVTVVQAWDDNPVAGARVRAYADAAHTQPVADLTTDAAGRAYLARAGPTHLVVTASGRQMAEAETAGDAARQAQATVALAGNLTIGNVILVEGEIRRGANATVRFTAHYPDGDPVFVLASARVALVGGGPSLFVDKTGLENETGTFAVPIRVPADFPANTWLAAVATLGARDALAASSVGPADEARSTQTYDVPGITGPTPNPPPTPPPTPPPSGDTVRPTSLLTSTYGAWTSAATLTLPFTASDNAQVASVALMASYSADGVAYGNAEQVASQVASPFAFTPSKDGFWRLHTLARDAAGNGEIPPAAPDVQVAVDRAAPVVRIVAPAEGVQPVALRLAADVVEANPAQASATLDGKALPVTLQGGTATATLPTLADGEHTLTLTVRDHAGNERSATRTFRVLASAPTITVTPLPAALPKAGVAVEVRVNATDLRHVEATLDGEPVAEGAQSPLSFRLDPAGLAHGEHNLTVVATDGLGAQGRTTLRFRVDAMPPTLALISPSGEGDVGATVAGEATDEDGSVAFVRLLLDGRAIGNSTGGAFSFAVDKTGLAPGRHVVALLAQDEAGNEARREMGFTVAAGQTPATPTPTTTAATPTPGATPTPATPTPPGDDEGNPMPFPGLAALLGALAAAGLVLRRRKA